MTEEATPERRRRERSVRYPGVTLAEAIEFCKRLEGKGLDGLSAEAIAAGLGYGSIKTNTFSARLSAARQFGLLELGTEGYVLSRRGRGLVHPIGEAVGPLYREAMAAPPLYAELLARMLDRKLPDPAALANVLYHQFDITATAKEAAAQAFIESARFAGMLDDQGVLRAGGPVASVTPAAAPASPRVARPHAAVRIDLQLWGADQGKVVRVRAPDSMSQESYERLLQALKLHVRIVP